MKTLLHIRIMAMGLFIFLIAGNNLTAQENWEKYEDNPVMDNYLDTQAWDRSYFNPTVLVINDTLLSMWYTGTNENPSLYQIGYAYSIDGGESWTSNQEPVISAGNTGDWNKHKSPNTVLLVNDTTLKMWYGASSSNYGTNSSIGYAWRHIDSTDWILNEEPVLEPGLPGKWDDKGVWHCSVIFDENDVDDPYKMWYHGWDVSNTTPDGEIGYATSEDGENWTKHPDNPIMLVVEGTFYNNWIIPGKVRFNGDEYEMWFTGWDGSSSSPHQYEKIGYATSLNGITWEVENQGDFVLDVGSAGDWDRDQVSVSSVVNYNGYLKMFFMGHKYANGYQIGLATESMVIGVRDLDQLSEFEMIISPNPSNDITTISYHLATASTTSIVIYNQQGQIISTLLDERKQSGDHEIKFDSTGLPSGVYFCVLKANDEIQTAKIVKL